LLLKVLEDQSYSLPLQNPISHISLSALVIDQYTSKDATILREWLIKKGLSNSSLQRVFSGIKAVINFVTLEHGLESQNAFAKVYLPSTTDAKKRHAVTPSNMAKIKAECLSLDDDIRWLVAIIFPPALNLPRLRL